MRVLIGGGTGFIGKVLHTQLLHKGHEVTVISRAAGKDRLTWNDLYRTGLPDDCDAIVNLAGENLMNPSKRWNDSFKRSLVSSRVNTTKLLAEAITKAKHPPKVWVSASGIGFYPPSKTTEYTEDSRGGTGDFMAELCTQWENAARLLPETTNVRHVCVRIGVALGRYGGTVKSLYLPFFFGLGGRMGTGQQWLPWIHVHDVAGIIVHAIINNNVKGVLNAVSPQPATNAEFTAAFGRAMWRPAVVPMPAAVLRCVFGHERASVVLDGQKVLPKRTLESGYQFVYPDLSSACKEFSHIVKPSELTH